MHSKSCVLSTLLWSTVAAAPQLFCQVERVNARSSPKRARRTGSDYARKRTVALPPVVCRSRGWDSCSGIWIGEAAGATEAEAFKTLASLGKNSVAQAAVAAVETRGELPDDRLIHW